MSGNAYSYPWGSLAWRMPIDWNGIVLVLSHLASLLLSGTITFFAFRAYRRTGMVSMRSLMIGFGIITVGLLFGGGLDWLTGLKLETSVTAQSFFTTVGLAFLLYSLFVEDHSSETTITS